MANDERRFLNPRTTQSLRGITRPRATDPPGGGMARPGATDPPGGGTARPWATDPPGGGTARPSATDPPGGGIPSGDIEEEEEGKPEPVVFAERLKSGYSAARNEQLDRLWKHRKGEHWKELGPDNLGGRVTCLVATSEPVATSESTDNRLIAGAACGGLWNGSITCPDNNLQSKWDPNPGSKEYVLLHNIGSLAIEGKTIYCGTGHAYRSGDSFPGVGLFRSDDNGEHWKYVKKAGKDFPQRVGTIAVKGKQVWVGGTMLPDEEEDESAELERSGIFYSPDAGETWERNPFKLDPAFASRVALSPDPEHGIFEDLDYQCHSIVFSESAQGPVIVVAITAPLNWGGIWRSCDDGRHWEQLKRGLPSPREFGRTSLAAANKEKNIVYAFAGAADGRCLGVFRSCDGGDHWVSHGSAHFKGCGSLNYVNCLAVSPTDSDLVVCGARDLHRSTDGGRTWTRVSQWFAAPDSLGYSHADHHALLWPDEKRLYSANDGGVDVSVDNGVTWRNLTHGLAVAMFYDIDVAASFPSKKDDSMEIPELIIAGGTQDNASVMTDFRASGIGYVPSSSGLQLGITQSMTKGAIPLVQSGSTINFDECGVATPSSGLLTPPGPADPFFLPVKQTTPQVGPRDDTRTRNFIEILYGDGGWTVFDPGDPLHVYGSSQYMTIYRHRRDNGWKDVTPEDASDAERYRIWMAILAMHPKDPNIVFTGSTRVWRTNNDGEVWVAVSDDLDRSPITAIEISDKDPNFIYVGTESGNIFKSDDGGNRWTDEPGDYRPKPMEWRKDLHERASIGVARAITRIEASPCNPKQIAVTLMGFDRKDKSLPHVLWFDGKKWSDVSRTLPNVHHNVVTWDNDGNYLFVANDVGVWAMHTPKGEVQEDKWIDISANLPNAIVTDLVYHTRTASLTAATYGRSLWWASERAWTVPR